MELNTIRETTSCAATKDNVLNSCKQAVIVSDFIKETLSKIFNLVYMTTFLTLNYARRNRFQPLLPSFSLLPFLPFYSVHNIKLGPFL
jgi:hypothetical protein